MEEQPFITKYAFHKDETKPSRILESVRVGGIYITRIIIQPREVIGNVYLRETNFVFFTQVGKVRTAFSTPDGTKKKSFEMCPQSGIIHVPPNVAFAMKNLENEVSVLVAFSNRPLHDHSDDEPFQVV